VSVVLVLVINGVIINVINALMGSATIDYDYVIVTACPEQQEQTLAVKSTMC